MTQNHGIAPLLASLLISVAPLQSASAQTVDPCQYGCPKSGCPQCPEGGPIKSQDAARAGDAAPFVAQASPSRQKCVQECQSNNRREVGVCNTLYPPSSQIANHRACLDKARNTFDGCMSAC